MFSGINLSEITEKDYIPVGFFMSMYFQLKQFFFTFRYPLLLYVYDILQRIYYQRGRLTKRG